MSEHDPQNNDNEKDDGSVWTSYSDMFTTMAVIFLVMFVFALLRSGVNTLKAVQQQKEHQEFLKGKVPQKVVKENQKRKEEVKESIKEMNEYQDLISSKLLEMNDFAKKMVSHKKVLEKLLKDQEDKEAAVKHLNGVLEKNEKDLKLSKELVERLEKEKKKKEAQLQEQAKVRKKLEEEEKRLEQTVGQLKEELVQKSKAHQAASKKAAQELKKVIEERQEKVHEIQKLSQLIQQKSGHVETLKKEAQELEQKLKQRDLHNQEIVAQERTLRQELGKLERRIESIQQERVTAERKLKATFEGQAKAQQKVEALAKALTKASQHNGELERKVASLEGSLSSVMEEGRGMKAAMQDLQGEVRAAKSESDQIRAEYEGKLKSLKGQYEGKLAGLKDQYEGQLQGLKGEFESKIGQMQGQYEGELKGLKSELAQAKGKGSEQQGKINELSSLLSEANQKSLTCGDDKEKLLAENQALRRKVGRLGRGIASIRKNLRTRIGRKIADRLKGMGANVHVNPENGNLILRMEGDFTFARNSAKLSKKAKEALKKVIPAYASALFADPKIAGRIEKVSFVGHASPRYGKQFVDPVEGNQEAYTYNLSLSTDRAKEIVKYVFGSEFGGFDHKAFFRQKVAVSGRSFSDPVGDELAGLQAPKNKSRGPASVQKTDTCGGYDCRASRRVEIVFTLKENEEELVNMLESLERE